MDCIKGNEDAGKAAKASLNYLITANAIQPSLKKKIKKTNRQKMERPTEKQNKQ